MRKVLIPILAFVLTATVCLYQAQSLEPVFCEAPSVKLGAIEGFAAQPYEPSPAELERLPKDTRFDKCMYRAADGSWFQVSVVIGGRSKSSIHRPELCLPSQGHQMTKPHTMTAAGRDWHHVTLLHADNPPVGFVYTFFNQAGYATSSHLARIFRDVWDRSIRGRIDRWVMVTVVSSVVDDERMGQFLSKLEGALK